MTSIFYDKSGLNENLFEISVNKDIWDCLNEADKRAIAIFLKNVEDIIHEEMTSNGKLRDIVIEQLCNGLESE